MTKRLVTGMMLPFRPTNIRCTQHLVNGRLRELPKPLKYFPGKHPPHAQGKIPGQIKQNLVYAPPQVHKALTDIYSLLAKHQNHKALEVCLKLAPHGSREDQAEYCRHAVGLFTGVHDFKSAVEVFNLMLSEDHPIHPSVILALLRGAKYHDHRHINQVFALFYQMLQQGKLKPDNILLGAMVNLLVQSGSSPKSIEDFIISCQKKLGKAWSPSASMVSSLIHAYAFAGDFDRALDLLVQLTTEKKSGENEKNGLTFMESVELQVSRDTKASSKLRYHISPFKSFEFPEKRKLSYGRTTSSFPYTSILLGYRKFMSQTTRPQELLHSLCRLMNMHGVSPDIEFCTTALDILGRAKEYDMVLAVYHILTEHPDYPFPASSTYRKLFSFSHQAISSDVPSAQYFGKCGPQFFLDMVFHQQALCGSSYDDKQKAIIVPPTLNAANRYFLASRDYQSVLVVLKTFNFYGLPPPTRTVDDILEFFNSRIKNSSDEDPWTKRFLNDLPRSINLRDLLLSLNIIGRYQENQAMMPNLGSPDDRALLWALAELVLRALVAEYVEIGWHLPQPVDVSDAVKTQVESAIKEAANRMIPKAIMHESTPTGWPQIDDFVYRNWFTVA